MDTVLCAVPGLPSLLLLIMSGLGLVLYLSRKSSLPTILPKPALQQELDTVRNRLAKVNEELITTKLQFEEEKRLLRASDPQNVSASRLAELEDAIKKERSEKEQVLKQVEELRNSLAVAEVSAL
jgi:chromosome segregation ATPase